MLRAFLVFFFLLGSSFSANADQAPESYGCTCDSSPCYIELNGACNGTQGTCNEYGVCVAD